MVRKGVKGVLLAICTLIILGTMSSAGSVIHIEKIGEKVIPTVSIENPQDGDILDDTTTSETTIKIYYSAGATGQVTDVWLYIDSLEIKHWTPNSNSGYEYYDWDYSSYAEGQHTIKAKVENLDGVTATDEISIYINLQLPYGYITSPSENDILSGNSVAFTVKAIDNGSGVYSIEYYIDDTLVHTEILSYPQGFQNYIEKTYYINTTKYVDGTHYIYAIIYDNSGNVHSPTYGWSYITSKVNIIVDNNPPFVRITQPNKNTFLRGYVNITVSAQDGGSGIDHVDFYIDGSKIYTDNTLPYSYSWNTANYGNGNHQIKVIAYDRAGFSATDSIYVYVDNSAPILKIISPSQNYVSNKVSVTIKWSGTDSNSGIDHYEIKIDNGHWINVGLNTTYVAKLSIGKHTIAIKAIDRAGNVAISEVTITIKNSSNNNASQSSPTGSLGWPILLIGIITAITIAGIIFALWKRRQRKPAESE